MNQDERMLSEIKMLCKEVAEHPGLDIDTLKLETLQILILQYILNEDNARKQQWQEIQCTD